MTIRRDVPKWRVFSTEGLVRYRERVLVYIATDRGWLAGPSELALLDAELRARGVDE